MQKLKGFTGRQNVLYRMHDNKLMSLACWLLATKNLIQ